jgi:hypothetical protein
MALLPRRQSDDYFLFHAKAFALRYAAIAWIKTIDVLADNACSRRHPLHHETSIAEPLRQHPA